MNSDFVRKVAAFVKANIKPLTVAVGVFFVAKFFPPFALAAAAFFAARYFIFKK